LHVLALGLVAVLPRDDVVNRLPVAVHGPGVLRVVHASVNAARLEDAAVGGGGLLDGRHAGVVVLGLASVRNHGDLGEVVVRDGLRLAVGADVLELVGAVPGGGGLVGVGWVLMG